MKSIEKIRVNSIKLKAINRFGIIIYENNFLKI